MHVSHLSPKKIVKQINSCCSGALFEVFLAYTYGGHRTL